VSDPARIELPSRLTSMSEIAALLHSPGVFDPVPDRERLLLRRGCVAGEPVEFDVPQQMRISAATN